MRESKILYGRGDATFQAVGGEQGVRNLVDAFYDIMSEKEQYRTIWQWHPDDKQLSRDKLYHFLCGWMGGPANYSERYGPINIPSAHAHLSVGAAERDMWLDCMREAAERLSLSNELSDYLIEQLSRPAEMVRRMCMQGG